MAGSIKINSVQLGDSATATQNFVWQTNVDGTAKLARGTVGATTQDILTVDASGRVSMPQTVVAFQANRTITQTGLTSNIAAKVQLTSKSIDTGSFFDNVTNYRFQPAVAGYYLLNYSIVGSASTSVSAVVASAYKNNAPLGPAGNDLAQGSYTYATTNVYQDAASSGSDVVQLNGSTDYVELFGRVIGAGSISFTLAKFSGILIAKA